MSTAPSSTAASCLRSSLIIGRNTCPPNLVDFYDQVVEAYTLTKKYERFYMILKSNADRMNRWLFMGSHLLSLADQCTTFKKQQFAKFDLFDDMNKCLD